MSYYRTHVFFCTNQRSDKPCCANHNSAELCDYAKQRVAELGLAGKGKIKVSSSGCMGRCSMGPAVAVYPQGVWYSYKSKGDIDKIINIHLVGGQIVDELII